MSIMVAVGRGARTGVLVKNAAALERLEKVDTLLIDKTGTLTEGRPAVTAIVAAPGMDENELLRLTASVERKSEHPLAQAIVSAATTRGLDLAQAEDFDSPVGKGALAKVDGKQVVVGHAAFLTEQTIDAGTFTKTADDLRRDGATAIYVAVDGKI